MAEDNHMEDFTSSPMHPQGQEGTLGLILQQLQDMQHQLTEQSARIAAQEGGSTQSNPVNVQPLFSTTPAQTVPKRPNLPDPGKFRGERFAYAAFEQQLAGKLQVDGAYLGGQDIQVIYAFGLWKGKLWNSCVPRWR